MLKRILYIILVFLPWVNFWPTWKGTDVLPVPFVLRVIIFIPSWLFYIPAVVFGLIAVIKG